MTYQNTQEYLNAEAREEYYQEIAADEAQLAQDLGQEPTLEEKLAALGMTLEEFNASIDEMVGDW